MKLIEAIDALVAATIDTNMEFNVSGDDGGIQIHWCGVIQLNTTPQGAAKAIGLFKQLEALGAKDC